MTGTGQPVSIEGLPPQNLFAPFGIKDAEALTETTQALLWKVSTAEHAIAVLKFYKRGHMGNEANGFEFLQAVDGHSAAKVFAVTEDAALIEYLPGPSLGDLARRENDQEAAARLVTVANALQSVTPTASKTVPTVEQWLAALFDIKYATALSAQYRAHFDRAKSLAQELLNSSQDVCFLHGDLHHDNIRETERGFCAFDAKGVVGEMTYELANAFRNPRGADQLIRDPSRIRFLRDLWSTEFAVSKKRLMQWACVKVGLSICWRAGDVVAVDKELDLLEIFFGILDETS